MQKYGKKKSYGKKRAYTKRSYRQYPKRITDHIHRYVRWAATEQNFPDASGPAIIAAQNTNQNLSYSFKLRNVVNAVDFTSLYDLYRINKITIYLEPFNNLTGDSVVIQPQNIRIRVVHDYNDNNVLTSENDYLEYSNCKSYQIVTGKVQKIVLYPKVAQIIENVGGSQGFNAFASNKVWLNTVDDQVPHFGIKMFIPGYVAPPNQNIMNVRVKFDMSFKNSK